MSLLVASPGHDAAAFARGHAIICGSSAAGVSGAGGLPLGWSCSIASAATDVRVESDLVVIVSGSPRWVAPGNPAATRPFAAGEIAHAWRSSGPSSLAALSADFALLIIEPATGLVHGCVDPFGLNSLFFASQAGCFVIGTEALAVAAVLGEASLDRAALQDVFSLRFLSGHRTLWRGVCQVLPGTVLTLDGLGEPRESEIRRIRFSPRDEIAPVAATAGMVRPMLEAAFARRRDEGMDHVAVPLSGGVDSSILAALAARTFPHATAYTVSMDGFEKSEPKRASDVASMLGLEHRLVRVTDADVSRLYAHVVGRLQEPPRHFNNIAIARLMEVMARECACIIAGDAADLLFGSGELNTLRHYARKQRALGIVPRPLLSPLRQVLGHLPGRRAASLARIAGSSLDELIQAFDVIPRSTQASGCLRGLGPDRRPTGELVAAHYEFGRTPYESFQTWHGRTFLTSIYRRNERLSRANGLRYWYPFMEPDIVEFATRMPSATKCDTARSLSKPVLRLLCDQLVGPDVGQWTKLGFPSPEREWMTGPLAGYLQECMAEDAMIGALFGRGAARRIDIRRDHQTLWTLMTLETVLKAARSATIEN